MDLDFNKEVFCFTGNLKLVKKDNAKRFVKSKGATISASVNKKTTILVIGDLKNKKTSRKLDAALNYIDKGINIKLMRKDEFLELMGYNIQLYFNI